MKYLFVMLLTLITYQTNSCNKDASKTVKNEVTIKQESSKNTYYVITLNGRDIRKEKLHITIDKVRSLIFGFSGCNTFSCNYKIIDNKIEMGLPVTSKVYCEEKNALEGEFLKALNQIHTKSILNDSISLKDNNSKELIVGIIKNEN